MANIANQKIDSFTSSDYVFALNKIGPTERQLDMLRFHLSAPDQAITARHLAFAMGYPNWNAANLQYGKFAGQLCKAMDVAPSTNLSVLVRFFKAQHSEYELRLREPVIEALIELGLLGDDEWSFQEEVGLQESFVEGATFVVQVNAFERSPSARKKCIDYYGFTCTVCGFDFGAAYGSSAEGYCHVHHLKPLSSIGEEYIIDPVKDLCPVCANCHSVIHLRQPPYSIQEVKDMLNTIKTQMPTT